MNDRQRAFVTAYLQSGVPTAAALAAGYTERGARRTGYRLLRDPEVRAEIRRLAPPTEDLSPLQFMRRVIANPAVPIKTRVRVAIEALPYTAIRRGSK